MTFTTEQINAYTALTVAAIRLGITAVDSWKQLIAAIRQDLTPAEIDAAFEQVAMRAEIAAAVRGKEAAEARQG